MCRVGDEVVKLSKQTTRVIKKTLNPVWDESMVYVECLRRPRIPEEHLLFAPNCGRKRRRLNPCDESTLEAVPPSAARETLLCHEL